MAPFESVTPTNLAALCESLKANADQIAATVIEKWRKIGVTEPWHALPDGLDFDHLPELIAALADAALCTVYDAILCREVAELAARHGEHRADEGLHEALIYREYHLLRRALWIQMKEEHGETATVYYATMRVDALISMAIAASLHGLNREALEAEGRWPEALDELVADWPLPNG